MARSASMSTSVAKSRPPLSSALMGSAESVTHDGRSRLGRRARDFGIIHVPPASIGRAREPCALFRPGMVPGQWHPPRQARRRPARAQLRHRSQVCRLGDDERPISDTSVARDHRVPHHWEQPLRDRDRPCARIRIAIAGGRVVLEQVAGEQDASIGHVDHDVVVGMPVAQVRQPQLAVAKVDRRGVGEHLVGRREHHLAQLIRELGSLVVTRDRMASPSVRTRSAQRAWPQIGDGKNRALPKVWSQWWWVFTTAASGSRLNP